MSKTADPLQQQRHPHLDIIMFANKTRTYAAIGAVSAALVAYGVYNRKW